MRLEFNGGSLSLGGLVVHLLRLSSCRDKYQPGLSLGTQLWNDPRNSTLTSRLTRRGNFFFDQVWRNDAGRPELCRRPCVGVRWRGSSFFGLSKLGLAQPEAKQKPKGSQ